MLASRIEPHLARLRLQALRLHAAWLGLSLLRRAAITAIAVTLIWLLFFTLTDSDACATRSDAEDRLADVMQDLHAQATTGALPLEDLARRVTEVNAAATALARTGDPQAYCDALETARTGQAH